MSVSSINNTPNYINLPTRAERITTIDNRIANNNRQIANLENQISAQQEVSAVIKELISNSNKKIDIYEKQIDNNINSINLIKQIVSNNEKIIGTLQETQVIAKEAHAIGESRLKNLQETQLFAKETLKLEIEQRDLLQECKDIIEKMLAIVMKNPSKYEGMSLKDFSEVSEVANIKNNLNKIVEVKVKDYPQENRYDLINVASKVIDHSLEKKSLVNLERKIDLALSKEILAKINRFDKSSVNIYRTNQNLYNEHYFTNIKKYSF